MNFIQAKRLSLIVLSSLTLFTLASCGKEDGADDKKADAPKVVVPNCDGSDVIAVFEGSPITLADVKKVGGAKLSQEEMNWYDARKDAVDQIIEDKLLDAEAKKQNLDRDTLLKKQVNDKIVVSDKEIQKFYEDKKAQMQNKKLEEVKDNIRNFISRDQYQKHYGDLVDKLRKGVAIDYKIQAPRTEVAEGDSPAIGPKNAPVTIIEFTDYECPFCGRARPAIKQVLQEYKGKVRYVMRDFPLSFHKNAVKAHEASHCANDQGKFWEMNDKLFDSQKDIKVEDLKKYASELKLNQKKFDECLDSSKYQAKVDESQRYGQSVGVSGTPAFFINGRMLSGARPFSAFKQIIDDELKLAR